MNTEIQEMRPAGRLLKTAEAARLIGMSPRTLGANTNCVAINDKSDTNEDTTGDGAGHEQNTSTRSSLRMSRCSLNLVRLSTHQTK